MEDSDDENQMEGDDDDDDDDDEQAVAEVEGGAGGAGGAGASTSGAPKAAATKKPAGPKPTSPLPALGHLARVLPYLRSTSIDASSLLTFTSRLDEPESEDRELTALLTAPSVHYLLANLYETLRAGLTPASAFGTFAGGKSPRGANGQDLSSMELSRLGPSALVVRLTPALRTLSRHAKILAASVPSRLECPSHVVDADAAYGGAEDEVECGRFVEPALMLVTASLRKLLDCKQLGDDAGQAALTAILGSFGADEDGAPEPSSQASPEGAAAVCFDFWADVFATLPSIALQSEVVGVCKAVLELLARHSQSSAAEVVERRGRLATLASSCLQRERADDRNLQNFQEKAPLGSMVKCLFEVETSHCPSPVELLTRWATEILPGLADFDLDDGDFVRPRETNLHCPPQAAAGRRRPPQAAVGRRRPP